MKRHATRRSFIQTAGIALSAPLVVVAATADDAAPAEPVDRDVELLRDREAIRDLTRRVVLAADDLGAGVRRIAADGFGHRDVIEIAGDRQTARVLLHCVIERDTAIEPAVPLVQMAREQGGGVLRRIESGVVEMSCVKHDRRWTVASAIVRADRDDNA